MVASSVGLGRDVAPYFALFKDEGNNFGKGNRFFLLTADGVYVMEIYLCT